MDIDEYLKQKKTLEEQKKVLEGKGTLKAPKEKPKVEKHTVPHTPPPTSHHSQPPATQPSGGSGVKTLMIVNMVILLGVLAVFAVFYLFPPSIEGGVTQPEITGQVVAPTTPSVTPPTIPNTTTNTTPEPTGTVYLGPDFDLSIEDSTEGPFDTKGKLANSGNILSIQGATFYNDFKLTIQNKEPDKILCAVDRKIDIDTDMDGNFDIEGVYSLDRHILKIKKAATEVIKKGIESVPGGVQNYQGKGELWVDYEVRCYFCLDERCDSYEKEGEEKRQAFFRVRINENQINLPSLNTTNQTP